ncbi:MAG: DUF1194 domain-containing protein [Pseudomonadota bacterium]
MLRRAITQKWPRDVIVALTFLLVTLMGPNSARAQTLVDLELILAVDASGSVDPSEYALQLQGIAAAIADTEVIAAIQSGPIGRIAIALIVWGEAGIVADESPWALIADAPSAERFAGVVAGFPRRVSGGTGIGAGLTQGMRMFDRNGFLGTRQVVDVSGDGRETPPRDYVALIHHARAMAQARGITINGLAILNDDPELDAWYRQAVITGPGAFVMTARNYDDFAEAMRRKLLREIENLPNVARH